MRRRASTPAAYQESPVVATHAVQPVTLISASAWKAARARGSAMPDRIEAASCRLRAAGRRCSTARRGKGLLRASSRVEASPSPRRRRPAVAGNRPPSMPGRAAAARARSTAAPWPPASATEPVPTRRPLGSPASAPPAAPIDATMSAAATMPPQSKTNLRNTCIPPPVASGTCRVAATGGSARFRAATGAASLRR